jgi:hypothetical protein
LINIDIKEDLDRDGYSLLKSLIGRPQLETLVHEIEKLAADAERKGAGVRNLLVSSQPIRIFAEVGLAGILSNILGVQPYPVRAILFEKSSDANWYVRWHQDRTIPVAKREEMEGFTAWSEKDGVIHCYPPADVLESMVAARIHIDSADATNGAIQFIPGTHKHGVLNDYEKERWKQEGEKKTIAAEPGDVILMRPLIMHASSKSETERQRRVLHIEYATEELPAPLKWGQA